MMKRIFTLAALLFILGSCRKDNDPQPDRPEPTTEYTHFNDTKIGFGQTFRVDLNHDSFTDFSIYSLLVGDPLSETDYHQYYFGSAYFTNFPINNKEEMPMLNKGDNIAESAFNNYNWYNASDIVMAQKVVRANESHWEGLWKSASHKYAPIRITVEKQLYYGWIEVSFNTFSEKVILHNAAISKEAGKAIRAGV